MTPDPMDETMRRLRQACQEALASEPLLDRWLLDRSLGVPCLVGVVTGHPLFPDGRFVRTSRLRRLEPEAGWAQTRNRFYRLGQSLDDWRKLQ
ncbi:DUF6634 family protein [Chenggangzhangella methanolivorans]|uniref:Uncharacterized protein n=1 Tax=Chenggangzhangella methanolivorans TaxID=1437009 RepID=A0A9E6R796_9HYPH|nr:DUF6634 family protein [Chenggangzhangella methanolivorans]QZN99139.1 hypothetical protein K6K41_20185 [Chenggangzhangella methanolivorans]